MTMDRPPTARMERDAQRAYLTTERAELLAIAREIAPPDRGDGWHLELCELEPDEWKRDRVAGNAMAQTTADRGPCPLWPYAQHPPRDQMNEAEKEWERVREAEWASWHACLEHHVVDLMAYVHEPTDAELCEPGCLYPSTRSLLVKIDSGRPCAWCNASGVDPFDDMTCTQCAGAGTKPR